MLRDITIGQYYPVQSAMHRLDPRTKLFGTLVFIAGVFLAVNPYGYATVVAALAGAIALSRIPVKHIIKGMKAVLVILLFTAFFNLFFTPGEELFHFWIISVTKEGLRQAIYMMLRLSTLVMGASLLTFTTTPTALTDGIEKGLGFLRVFRIPVHEIAMMMSIALRFIPILMDETDKIMRAQMARGAEFDTGGLMKKAKAMVPLLVPLFVSAFRRASDLAQAMEARCYHGGKGRTKLYPLKYGRRDLIAYLIIAAFLAAMILLMIFT